MLADIDTRIYKYVSLHARKKEKGEDNGMRVTKRATRVTGLQTRRYGTSSRPREIVQRSSRVGYGDGPRIVFVYLEQRRPGMNKQQRSFFETI